MFCKITSMDNKSWLVGTVDYPKILIVQYIEDEFVETYPELHAMGYDLLFFVDQESAVDFAEIHADDASFRLWEIETEDEHHPPMQFDIDTWVEMQEGGIPDLHTLQRRYQIAPYSWPDGTMMARRIKLVRLIQEYEWSTGEGYYTKIENTVVDSDEEDL